MSGSPCMVTTDGGTDGGGDLPIEQLFDAQLTAICDYFVRCGMFEDTPKCKTVFGSNAQVPYDIVDAVNMGKVNYDASKARACIDAIAQRSCERWNTLGNRPAPVACTEVLTGTVASGGVCVTNEQCTSQDCVQPANCPMACCMGTCSNAPPPGPRNVGQACANGYCVGGYCDFAGVCAAYLTQGSICNGDFECADGLNCRINPTDPTMRSCQMMTSTNGPCGSSSDCLQSADICVSGACRTGGLTGDTCQLPMVQCQSMHQCSGGKCALPPGPGQSCNNYPSCIDSYCDPTTLACLPKLADGQTCNPQLRGTECMSGVCDSASRCVTPNCF
jgi:hypothetical protein